MPAAPAGDALAAARQDLIRNVAAYVPGALMEDVSRWLDAIERAAWAVGAAEALTQYGKHLTGCRFWTPPNNRPENWHNIDTCDCGFAARLSVSPSSGTIKEKFNDIANGRDEE